MQGIFIAANESESTDVAIITGHTDVKKHFTTWMQEGQFVKQDCFMGGFQNTKRLVLADGTSLSIQAGGSHYCSPRHNLPYQEYEEFEIGFPSRVIDEIIPYADDEDNPTDTVYSYVPMGVIERFIQKAGGVVAWPEQLIKTEGNV